LCLRLATARLTRAILDSSFLFSHYEKHLTKENS
jgi:hypothetical protein